MKATYLTLVLLLALTQECLAGCEDPFGTFASKSRETVLEINANQSLTITAESAENSGLIYEGKIYNLDEMIGTEYLNFENPLMVQPSDPEQSHICLHVADDCGFIKLGVCRKLLEQYGGTPPELNANLFWKVDP